MEMEIPQRSLAMEAVIRQHTPMICCTIRYQEPMHRERQEVTVMIWTTVWKRLPVQMGKRFSMTITSWSTSSAAKKVATTVKNTYTKAKT